MRWLIVLGPLVAALVVWAWRTRGPKDIELPDPVTPQWIRDQSYSRRGDRP